MKLWGVAMVRNEADIIEAFVRHNLSVLDGLAVIDHGSIDATLPILVQLAREGLPMMVMKNELPGYLQEHITTQAARDVFAQTDASHVFPLDADEFLKTPSPALLRRAVGAIPQGMHGLFQWLTYVPDFEQRHPDMRALLRSARRLPEERHGFYKAIVGRHILDTPDALLASGNHVVLLHARQPLTESPGHARVRLDAAALAHVPIRSEAQLVAKVAIKKLGRIASRNDWLPDAASQAAYECVIAGRPITPQTLRAQAINWSVRRERWVDPGSIVLVDDPFLASFPLRYSPAAAADPLPLILAASERLARNAARPRAATP